MTELFIRPEYLAEIRNIIKTRYPKAVVWAYGSRVDGTAHHGSDLDLAVVSFGTDNGSIAPLKADFSKSNIPFLIDVVVFDQLPASFQSEIKTRYTTLYDGT